ncbi:MAG: cob(I)yrinic acid a,c-diamide adenosyltransferase [Euryarchaeota archaeon]|nr:cob(I)yrinic acid a,c-diamide adenosyltransferase [Euryarchaeota archaeon]MDE1838179.1 cob(I)yrinic acid a,c-diamide adenosyltransferase [Euryarchaeota archaeon]MDE1882094.1 cob(I)yrinic acid a,c-diamide adenosyltransferase [Euryarchaeota archaeon]MDE2046748.1 cob(I)yrinic acid a,c-diamide adenosyltransferase [Thermoplasmata archaeon]
MPEFYTGGGDWGETSLADGTRVGKGSPEIALMGGLDELNAHLGLARSLLGTSCSDVVSVLGRLQDQLFTVGAELALPVGVEDSAPRITMSEVVELEREIDRLSSPFSTLRSFVVPGGSHGAAQLHVARGVARRVELLGVALFRDRPVRHEILVYLNRLSSLLFVLALHVNRRMGFPERPPSYLPADKRRWDDSSPAQGVFHDRVEAEIV